MFVRRLVRAICTLAPALASLFFAPVGMRAQNQEVGKLRFTTATKIEKDSGVWIDREYAGYLNELKGDKQVTLPPGIHEVTVRHAGYQDFTKEVVVESAQVSVLRVEMQKDPQTRALYRDAGSSTLKLDVLPKSAGVFVDDAYIGHASEFGGSMHWMVLSPGKHRVKIALPGFRPFETEVDPGPSHKAIIKTELVKDDKDSLQQTGAMTKQP
jgi:hypothetical protein